MAFNEETIIGSPTQRKYNGEYAFPFVVADASKTEAGSIIIRGALIGMSQRNVDIDHEGTAELQGTMTVAKAAATDIKQGVIVALIGRNFVMNLMDFASQVTSDIMLSPQFYGYEATYSRRIEAADGSEVETKTCRLMVSPQGNWAGISNHQGDVFSLRFQEIWMRKQELKFDGEEFLPKKGDMIEFEANGSALRYAISEPYGITKTFGLPRTQEPRTMLYYEDGPNNIIKVTGLKQ